MTDNITLRSVFESKRSELEQKLNGLLLPNDAEKVQKIITKYLSELFDEEGAFRQNLTQSEDYILNAALSMLSAQQGIVDTISASIPVKNESLQKLERVMNAKESNNFTDNLTDKNITPSAAILGSGGGALLGQITFGGWGAFFGAIAGTAIVVYLASKKNIEGNNIENHQDSSINAKQNDSVRVEPRVFCSIVMNICDSVDSLIKTYRNQISNVVNKYESIEKPTLENSYQELLSSIQALLGAYAMDASNSNRLSRIEQKIQQLSDSLDNYDIQSVNYDGNNKEMFNFQPSSNVTVETMVLPAMIKGGKVIMKGKVFINE